jgi:CRISPR-associated endoribonuclease Cas6
MPFSILIQGYPNDDVPVPHVQGPALQGMLLHLIRDVDPAVTQRLHTDQKYRPYTLSPLGIGEPTPDPSQKGNYRSGFDGFRLPRQYDLQAGTPCYLRVTFLEDMLFPTFSRYFLDRGEPTFQLGSTEFTVTNVLATSDHNNPWSTYISYTELIEQASPKTRKISLQFLTPTSFRRGNVDFPMPDPRLVFRSYRKRFEEFYQVAFLPDFDEQVEYYTGIADLYRLQTTKIKTKKVPLIGFTGKVSYYSDPNPPPDLVKQINLLADYAFCCATGTKTTVGMGQTVRSELK